MVEIDVKEMLEAGVHFGHKKDKWNPKMRPFIYTERNGVHIFDLLITADMLKKAQEFVGEIASKGGTILFVGTKNQIQDVVKKAAEKAGMPYMVERWPGGMLTNFSTILGRLKYLKEAEEKTEKGIGLTKKETLNLKRELEKLNAVFEGIKEIRKVPEAVFVSDILKEKNALLEAKKLGIPVIGIVDTNVNPTDVDFPIPANDDAVRSVEYIAEKIAEAILENKGKSVLEESGSESENENVEAKKERPSIVGQDDAKALEKADDIAAMDLEQVEKKLEKDAIVKKPTTVEKDKVVTE